mgnify:CR=1 FL=1
MMSNFAEFDVPEPVGTQEEQAKTEANPSIDKDKKTKPNTAPKSKNVNKVSFKPAVILSIVGLLALLASGLQVYSLASAILNVKGLSFPVIAYPFQSELVPYTIPLMLIAFISLKLSVRIPAARLGLFVLYIVFTAFILVHIYNFLSGQFHWV